MSIRICSRTFICKTLQSTFRQISRRNYAQRYNVIVETSSLKFPAPGFRLASQWPERIAITDQFGDYSYRNVFNGSKTLADTLTEALEEKVQERVSFLCKNDASYIMTLWACWMTGQIGVPLNPHHPDEMLEYFLLDSETSVLVTTNEYAERCQKICEKTGVRMVIFDENIRNSAIITAEENEKRKFESLPSLKAGLNPNLYSKLDALIIYTSGSTAMPKGVVLSHANLHAQVNAMIRAWEWTSKDSILHALPLHHVHGLTNALLTPLQCGARCVMLPKFEARKVWNYLLAVKIGAFRRITVFTGVPTMYVKLIEEYEKSLNTSDRVVSYVKASCSQKIRLMMCGSAPLPEPIFEKWEHITGHRLLERYGMSEMNMALSNPLHGERRPGFVGTPLPGVNVRIWDKDNVLVQGNEFGTKIVTSDNISPKDSKYVGELQTKGENVFKQYWKKPDVTAEVFTKDGWFRTGDTAQYIDGGYKILGRSSVDIIKSGGYKISALFVETILLQHPNIKDIAVVGLPDSTWGQQVAAVIVSDGSEPITVTSLKEWAKSKLPSYSIPVAVKIVPEIPRNLMGKVNKKELLAKMFPL
ncbi:malonate--CoA ligase ACSF3, mitochondrial [Planococcus citri]|uniref:malonate--CoA ligase ACSF3, mitochondrial n=1 Tax=Planococcus citri TaxID=170843 RepID=UPI0031F72316